MRPYVKPELYCEAFELSQHIAACGIDVINLVDKSSCAQLDEEFWPGLGGTSVFSDNTCGIDIGNIDVYCYTVGTSEAGRTFNS